RLIRTQPISYPPDQTRIRACCGNPMTALRRAHGDTRSGTRNGARISRCVTGRPHSPKPRAKYLRVQWDSGEARRGTCADRLRPACSPSLLADELFCRLHGLRAEIVVPDAGKAHEAFGRVDQAVEPLRQRHRHDIVAVAVQHQHRRRDLADAQIRAELVLHQQPYRHEPISLRPDIGGGGKRGLQDEMPDRLLCRQRDRNAGTERFAPEHDALRWVTRAREGIGRQGVVDEARFGRRAARAAVATVAERHEPGAVGGQIAEAIDPSPQRSAIAVEIEHHWLVYARRHVPDDHALAVGGVEHHLLRLRQAGHGGRGAKALGEILHRALPEIEQRDDGAVAEEREDHEPLEGVHCPVIPRRLYGHLSKQGISQCCPWDSCKTVQKAPNWHQWVAALLQNISDAHASRFYHQQVRDSTCTSTMRVRLRARLEVTFLAAMAWSAPAQDTPFRTDRCRLGLTRLHLMALSSLAMLAIPFASAKIMCA